MMILFQILLLWLFGGVVALGFVVEDFPEEANDIMRYMREHNFLTFEAMMGFGKFTATLMIVCIMVGMILSWPFILYSKITNKQDD